MYGNIRIYTYVHDVCANVLDTTLDDSTVTVEDLKQQIQVCTYIKCEVPLMVVSYRHSNMVIIVYSVGVKSMMSAQEKWDDVSNI